MGSDLKLVPKQIIHFLFNLENGKIGTLASEEEAFDYSSVMDSETRALWAISTDRNAWLPLNDWHRLKTTQSDFNPDPFYMDRRLNPRFNLRFQVNLVSACRSFASYTEDVSEGGLRLERPIPISVQNVNCNIQIISPKNTELIQFKGCVTTTGEDTHSMKFEDSKKSIIIPQLLEWVTQANTKYYKKAA
jgi:hypothetical protein